MTSLTNLRQGSVCKDQLFEKINQQFKIEDCAKDGGFTFFAKDDGKKFLINKLRHSAAVATQNSSCSDKIPNDTLSKICLGHR